MTFSFNRMSDGTLLSSLLLLLTFWHLNAIGMSGQAIGRPWAIDVSDEGHRTSNVFRHEFFLTNEDVINERTSDVYKGNVRGEKRKRSGRRTGVSTRIRFV